MDAPSTAFRGWNLAYWVVVIAVATGGGVWLFLRVIQRPPDLSATEDELLLGTFTIPIVLAAWGLRVGVRAVRRR